MSSSSRSDWASVPIRGSRLAGLLSIITTSVLASGCFAQPVSEAKKNTARAPARQMEEIRPRPCALRIRNLAQHRCSPGARCRRNIAWSLVPRLISEDGEGDCFLGLTGQPKLIRLLQSELQWGQPLSQHSHQSAVPRPTTRDDVIAEFRFRQNKLLDARSN